MSDKIGTKNVRGGDELKFDVSDNSLRKKKFTV